MLVTRSNPISLAMTLDHFPSTELGSMLFLRGVSGTRVVNPRSKKTVCGIDWPSYGAS